MKNQSFKLTIDLVPDTCWYSNLRNKMPQSKWDKLRKQIYAEVGHSCQICGAKGRLDCHEVWAYDDKKFVQKLKGFVALCSMCHHVKHFGMSQILADQGHLDLHAVIDHFCKVNSVSRNAFQTYKSGAFGIWRKRSKHQWRTDLGEWADLVSW